MTGIYAVEPDASFRLMFPEKTIYRPDEWKLKRKPLDFDAYFSDTDDALADIA